MVSKLIDLGLNGNLVAILWNFLNNRTNKVTLNGKYSETFHTEAGTPQGSVLSPTLFNIMLHDIPQQTDINKYIYADDISNSTVGNKMLEAQKNMQKYMKTFTLWTKD